MSRETAIVIAVLIEAAITAFAIFSVIVFGIIMLGGLDEKERNP